jgi:cytochrome P450
MLRRARADHGEVFTLRLTTLRPLVVVACVEQVEGLLAADPDSARAGEARRRMLPIASPRSMFGADGGEHRTARRRRAPLLAPEAVVRHRPAIAEIAARHVGAWPRSRPTRLLHRVRALVDDVFVRCLLGVADDRRAREIAAAIAHMLRTPGNPPLTIPGPGDGALGALGAGVFKRNAPRSLAYRATRSTRGARARTATMAFSRASRARRPGSPPGRSSRSCSRSSWPPRNRRRRR